MIQLNGLIGLKTSFEDEGASNKDAIDILTICNKNALSSTIKIGGCEAKTDTITCMSLGVNNIVAPMIETQYAFKKFKMMCKEVFGDKIHLYNFYVNVETVTAIKNLNTILELNDGFLKGLVFGRSDIVGSLSIDKDKVDSDEVFDLIRPALVLAKEHNLTTTIGGNLTSKSEAFVMKLFNENLLDKVETRLAVCSLRDLRDSYSSFIDNAIELEKSILQKRIDRLERELYPWKKRYVSIDSRTSFVSTVEESEKTTLVLDFDKVIHDMTKGFHDGTIYGKPLKGTSEALKLLSEKFELIVYSCKSNPARPLINGKTGTELIWEWLKNNKLDSHIKDVTFNKPNAVAYVDDKAIRFTTWEKCLTDLKSMNLL
tara:strand:+ start:1946 stop:3061 length:1116 start_codon:yes stop_codon:yes gene_type:complete